MAYPIRQAELKRRCMRASLNRCLLALMILFAGLIVPARLPAKEKADLLVTGGTVVTMDSARRVLVNGAVAVRGDSILDIGSSGEILERYETRRQISAKGKIVLPGLINAHNHAPMTLLRGIADDLNLSVWLEKYIFPAEAKNVTGDFVEWGTALACLEMIRSGTTTYADMYYFEEQIAEVTVRAGMRGVLGETVIHFPAPDNKTPEEALLYAENFIKRWKSNILIIPAVAPHAPYTNQAESLKQSKTLADKYGVPMMVHVSETQQEEKQIREKYGVSSTQWLESLGVLGPNVLFHHGVWLSDDDLAIIRKRNVSISHNPESNMKLSSGAAPVARMLKLGIRVGLGTDGAASNNNLDMFETMDFAAKLQKLVAMDPTVLPAFQALEMATSAGARALGMDRDIGSLEKGKKADFILIDVDNAHAQPVYDIYSQLVYSIKGADVRTSVINGKVVMFDGKVLTLDEKRILEKARVYREKVLESMGKTDQ
jgi:5-methylthioadenosine/S-adenosylhomocysteine deaminase